MHIHQGNVSGLLSVGGLTGILIDGDSGSISVDLADQFLLEEPL